MILSKLGRAQKSGSVLAFTALKSTRKWQLPSLFVVRNTGEFHSEVLFLIMPASRRSSHSDSSFCSLAGSYQNHFDIAGLLSFSGMVWHGTQASGTWVTFSAIMSSCDIVWQIVSRIGRGLVRSHLF